MKEVEYFNWWLPATTPRGKPYVSRWKMTRKDAAQRYSGAEPYLPSREVRMEPETDAERYAADMRFIDRGDRRAHLDELRRAESPAPATQPDHGTGSTP